MITKVKLALLRGLDGRVGVSVLVQDGPRGADQLVRVCMGIRLPLGGKDAPPFGFEPASRRRSISTSFKALDAVPLALRSYLWWGKARLGARNLHEPADYEGEMWGNDATHE